MSLRFCNKHERSTSPVLPCNLSTVCRPAVVSVSLVVLVLRVLAMGFQMHGDHWLGPRLTAGAVGSWGRLGAFVFRSALVRVILFIWGRGIVRAFLSSSRALAPWNGLSCKRLKVENQGREKEMPSKNNAKKKPIRYYRCYRCESIPEEEQISAVEVVSCLDLYTIIYKLKWAFDSHSTAAVW